jgi:hypothetical protein
LFYHALLGPASRALAIVRDTLQKITTIQAQSRKAAKNPAVAEKAKLVQPPEPKLSNPLCRNPPASVTA